MSFGLGISGALEGAAQGAGIGNAIPGIGTTIGGIIGGGMGLLGGLFGRGGSMKDQERLMEKAWEYEKEGMGMQYQYGQAADAAQRRNLEMWNSTNYEQQRAHMENAGLSAALMYGGSGAGSTSTAGGQATQPSGPTSNPVGMALQYKQIEQQDAAIKSQTMLRLLNIGQKQKTSMRKNAANIRFLIGFQNRNGLRNWRRQHHDERRYRTQTVGCWARVAAVEHQALGGLRERRLRPADAGVGAEEGRAWHGVALRGSKTADDAPLRPR